MPLTFTCSICGEPSHDICVACTKDACANHRCARCKRCSDCCGCDAPLSAVEVEDHVDVPEPVAATPAVPEPEPETEPELEPFESLPELFRPE